MSGLDKNRRRNQTICFRMSPEERRQLEARIIVSGMPKGQYFIESLLHQEIYIAVGKYQSDRLSLELRRLRETIEAISCNENEEFSTLLCDCKALLEQLMLVITQEKNIEIRPVGYTMEKQ
ncbi:MAG TPA: hypothetical protein VHP31_02805 [Caproicibacter sp.]|nr:hypothetical protein [Caproicibacter sp.]